MNHGQVAPINPFLNIKESKTMSSQQNNNFARYLTQESDDHDIKMKPKTIKDEIIGVESSDVPIKRSSSEKSSSADGIQDEV